MADHRHKRDTNARRLPKGLVVAGPLAFLATVSAVTLGVLGRGPEAPTSCPPSTRLEHRDAGERRPAVSRADVVSRGRARGTTP